MKQHEKDAFNFELDQIRKMRGLRKGTTMIFNSGILYPVGYSLIMKVSVNDNEAKG